jgi:hypothetical protein
MENISLEIVTIFVSRISGVTNTARYLEIYGKKKQSKASY